MSDRYGELVQSKLGKTVAKNLGLPTPTKLDRYQVGQPVLRGEVVFGMGGQGAIYDTLCQILADLDAKITPLKQGDSVNPESRYKVALFDASELTTPDDLKQVYDFFHVIARQ